MSPLTITRRYPLPLGFEITFTVGTTDTGEPKFIAEWSPRLPGRFEHRRLTDAYRVARHQFLTDLSEQMGGGVVCVEV